VPSEIPSGTWNYKLLVNDSPVGSATLSNRREKDTYVITSDLLMTVGDVKNSSKQIVTETLDFKPLKIETYNRTTQGAMVQNVDTVAIIQGRNVEVQAGRLKTRVTLDRDFILDGNYIMSWLIAGKFKEGMHLRAYIYDPSIEVDRVIPISTRLLGRETVTIGGKPMRLYHVIQSLESVKSADSYLDEQGILFKAVIRMLNLKIELVRE
jgi:hypothetical protein